MKLRCGELIEEKENSGWIRGEVLLNDGRGPG